MKLCLAKTTKGKIFNNYGNSWIKEPCCLPKGHNGEHAVDVDCCGDRYWCGVCTKHCEFCGQNDGWCSACLEHHERSCARKQIRKLRALKNASS